ncbi:MAG TPA: porin [Polyangia bacterium]
MKKSVARFLFLVAVLFGQRVVAQEAAAGVADSADAAPAGRETAVHAEAASAPEPAASDPLLASKVAALEAKVKGLEAREADSQVREDNFSHLKLSGYVQGRYEWHQDANNGWSFPASGSTGTGSAGAKDYFYVKRARLITVYNNTNAELVAQIDASGTSFAAKDLEAAFIDTWTPLHLRISIGQFKYPFGYELQQSDVVREMPERSRFILSYFPGERDRGLKIQGKVSILRFQVAVVNGNGTQDAAFGALDSNNYKDVVGRVGVDRGFIAGGVSGWYGPDSLDTSNTDKTKWLKFKRARVGADLQGYVDVPHLGNLALRGEAMYSREKNQEYNGVAASVCQDRVGWGWSLIAAQNLGKYAGAVVRVDGYDPLTQGSLDSVKCAGTADKPGTYVAAGTDRVITYGGGLMGYASPNFKVSLIYEHPTEQGRNKVNNDIFTAQLQASF